MTSGRDADDATLRFGAAAGASAGHHAACGGELVHGCEVGFMARTRGVALATRTVGPGSDRRTRIASFPSASSSGVNEMANNDNNQRGGNHEQHVKAGEQSHKNNPGGSHSGSGSGGSRSSSGGSRGGSHEDHVRTGEQNHKNV